ncbi:hypothetical protein ACFQJC_00165 [Haloferax namakaokahaiae]|uniref:DUF8054 domain-containing protein n=1 Tax=Haloferax namakaokahaiae TaxID=1748331 RepID=A0ABD5Z9S8_9EURY
MPRHGVSLGIHTFEPLLTASGAVPIAFLTILCGILGFIVWTPYGVVLGALPPAVVFFLSYNDQQLQNLSLPELPSACPTAPLSLDNRNDLVNALESADVLTTDSSGKMSVSSEFKSEWRGRMVDMGGRDQDSAALATLLGVHPARVELDWEADKLVATLDGGSVGQWSSRAAFVADLTAVATFRRQYPAWWRLSTADRNRVLGALRLSLQRCPTCDGRIDVTTSLVETDPTDEELARPDSSAQHVTATCLGCESHLFDSVISVTNQPAGTDAEAGTAPQSQ